MSNEKKEFKMTPQEVEYSKALESEMIARRRAIVKKEMHSESLTDEEREPAWVRKKTEEEMMTWMRKEIALREIMNHPHRPTDSEIKEWRKGKGQALEKSLKGLTEEEIISGIKIRRAKEKEDLAKKKEEEEPEKQHPLYPTEDEIQAWWANKKTREGFREGLREGPNEEERDSWARRELARREWAGIFEENWPVDESRKILKEAEKRRDDGELAVRGLVSSFLQVFTDEKRPLTALDGGLSGLMLSPFVLLERLIRAGQKWEDDEGKRGRITDDK